MTADSERRPDACPVVCTIVLNWNRPDETLVCLNALLPSVLGGVTALIICDNGSDDDSVPRFRDWVARAIVPDRDDRSPSDWDVLLIHSPRNLGYAGGNNPGILRALSRGFRYIWILNNDIEVAPGALDALVDCADRDASAMIFGSTVLDFTAREKVQYAGGARYLAPLTMVRNPYRGMPVDLVRAASRPPKSPKLDYVSGCAMFCRAELFRSYGLLDERFFLYFEELDLAHRLPDPTSQLKWCPESLVFHHEGHSTGGRSACNGTESVRSSYHENLSALRLTRKHWPGYLPIAMLARLCGKSLAAVLNGRWHLLRPLILAFLDFLKDPDGRHGGRSEPPITEEILACRNRS
ncbi:glycosyltransferase family 2 protein [Thiocapsa bogorovii]|uniref:glycosyltransferase family 2 protein n=1 Tax=Thiocapsa bogorovii TaxID=521689 RepID=UPI001E384FAE|nr:glycosyltransferase family 2 protein [Thiocapsa bogorovii]UHD14513.1 glycosyltransferase family 2 protein [Thiocapsa bogorovii]